ncbi:MAG: alcohol dehydrogenase [Chloroflexota bacterium]|nr:MAG: alcohol dehydrogenase [Chloroflexota bacterium]
MLAVVVDHAAPNHLALRDVAPPSPAPSEALVRAAAFSLNRGEIQRAMNAKAESRPGWDIAGTVEKAAADGSGPAVGTRVVGLAAIRAWAELVAVPTDALATLPVDVSFTQAATLPVAGLTALHAVERATGLIGRKVLVTGASGGVGLFACQLAHLAGARVAGLVRDAKHAAMVEGAGAERAIISIDGTAAKDFGPYRLIVESVGSGVLENVVGMLAPDGVCVSFGATAGADIPYNLWSLIGTGGASLYGLGIFNALKRESAAIGLERLVYLVATQRLRPHVAVEASWTEVGQVAQQLLDRRMAGKAVLRIDSHDQ